MFRLAIAMHSLQFGSLARRRFAIEGGNAGGEFHHAVSDYVNQNVFIALSNSWLAILSTD